MLPERPYDHFHSWSIVSCTTENAQTSRGWEENISHSRAPSSGRREAGPRPLGIWMVCFKSCNFGRNLLQGFPKHIPDNRILSSDAFETCWVNICGKHSFILGYHEPYLCQGTLGIWREKGRFSFEFDQANFLLTDASKLLREHWNFIQ